MEHIADIARVFAWLSLILVVALPWFVGFITIIDVVSEGVEARKRHGS